MKIRIYILREFYGKWEVDFLLKDPYPRKFAARLSI